MNTGGRPNTCKSNGRLFFGKVESGERVRNAYATYLLLGHSPEKFGLISHVILRWHLLRFKDLSVEDGHA